ncbi:glycosyltransferase family 2 protein [Rhodopirellula halodulae]|uniref:glycosyltransferase family 2 protein n=1 Tax=Rhodopirellula halodulae TaxID=2894198 RepID=UPI001E323D29|nr:glycosyltransferase family 2 protein [Rhodopirellula sp. JC737]MCC9656086.1 glycosyltransferase family 2 protein [Rhodopirellula sp. JC737]
MTKDEERDLPACLAALDWCDDVHVLDSGSSDRTIAIAEESGAQVSYHPFASFGKQRNHALDELALKHDWILFLDADEVATKEFSLSILDAVESAGTETAGFYCCWKMMLESRWLKRCDSFPKWQFRLLRKGMARFTDFGHGQKECDLRGEVGYIREPYLHFGFSKGWSNWISRHNRYSTDEAMARFSSEKSLSAMFDRAPSVRNPAIKLALTGVPGWPLIRFLHAYIIKLGFLEGAPGFIYCVNIAYYEFLIKIKMREMQVHQDAEKAS